MNKNLSGIFGRRSIRRFSDRPVEEGVLRDLLEAGMAAPSACGKDPWHFIVVRDQAMRSALAEALPYGKMLVSSPAAVVIVGDLADTHDQQLSYMLQDCSAAIENILVAAHMLGLGTCWVGIHPREDRIQEVRRVCGIPEAMTPISAIALGYPGEQKEARTRYAERKVHYERW